MPIPSHCKTCQHAMNIVNSLIASARSQAHQVAIYHGETPYLSWRELEHRVLQLAAALQQLGISRGHCVALAMSNCPQFIEVLYACWRLGAIAVPMNAKGHPADFRYMLEHSEAALCFATTDLEHSIQQANAESSAAVRTLVINSTELTELIDSADVNALPEIPADDAMPAWLFYTSGTTGRPKGAILTHRNLLAMAASYLSDLEKVESKDKLIHAAPMSHGSGLYIIPYISNGASQVVPVSGKFKEEELVALINRFHHCALFAAPTMLQRLLDNPATDSLPGLKCLILGGGPLYMHDCARALKKFGPKIAQIYGQGETPMTITLMTRQQLEQALANNDMAYLGSVGKPFSDVEVAVVDSDDQPLAAGETGEIVVRGATVMQGYWKNPGASAETLRNGWLHTGDVGSFDSSGVLTLKDRCKDLIISGGTNIYPREVEEVLIRHPAVKEACVVGIADNQWGESVVAALVAESGSTINPLDIDNYCLENLARFKRPKHYRIVDELPKNATGKVLKADVKLLFNSR